MACWKNQIKSSTAGIERVRGAWQKMRKLPNPEDIAGSAKR